MLRNIVVGRTRPQSMLLAMFTMRKELHGLLFLYMHVILFLSVMGLCWGLLRLLKCTETFCFTKKIKIGHSDILNI